jgi:predicted PurR-regulated permease PerM
MIGAPIVVFLRKYLGKTIAALVTLSLFGLILVSLLYTFIPPVVNQARYLSRIDYKEVVQSIEEPIMDWENWLIDKGLMKRRDFVNFDSLKIKREENSRFSQQMVLDSIYNPKDSSYLPHIAINLTIDASDLLSKGQINDTENNARNNDFFIRLRENIIQYINPSKIQELFTSTFAAFGNVLVAFLSVFFIAFFFLKEQGLFFEMVKTAVSEEYEERTLHAIDESSKLLIRYFIGILLQITFITVFVSIFLKILGIENALLIAFFAAILNVIPYVGPIIGASFGIIITISSNLDVSFYKDLLPQITKVLMVFGIMQLLDNFILQPNIFSKSVKAHPLEIFLIVLVGAKLGGILGMVLAIPFYTVFRVIAKVFLSEFKVIQRLTKNL